MNYFGLNDPADEFSIKAHRDVETFIEDMGFERVGQFSVSPKAVELELDAFVEGAKQAVEFVSTAARAGDSAALAPTVGGALRSVLALEAKTHVLAEGDDVFEASLERLAFVVGLQDGAEMREEDLQPRSDGWATMLDPGKLLDRLFGGRRFHVRLAREDRVLSMYEASTGGMFCASFVVAQGLVDAVDAWCAKRGVDFDLGLEPYLVACKLTWPDLHSDKRLVGWMVAQLRITATRTGDGGPPPGAALDFGRWTFARPVDVRPAARWDHDWKVVDVKDVVTKQDVRTLRQILA